MNQYSPQIPSVRSVRANRGGASVVLLTALLSALVAATAFRLYPHFHGAGSLLDPVAKPAPVAPKGPLTEAEKATISLFEEASPAVVHVTSLVRSRSIFNWGDYTEIPQGTGSGFMWDERGYVVTNYHVVRNSEKFVVTLPDNTEKQGTLVGYDATVDIAVLKIDTEGMKVPVLKIGRSNDLKVGQRVYAIGNPFGFDQTLTTGIISGLNREIRSVINTRISGVIQTDAAINPGNSGGPLLDSSGRLIGVNTAIYSPSGASAGIGFAVPVDTVNEVVPQILRTGQQVSPWLGVSLAPDNWVRQQRLRGAVVYEVVNDGPAADAGIRPLEERRNGEVVLGDIIVGVNDIPVRSGNELIQVLKEYPVGKTVKLNVYRNRRQIEVPVRLEAMPEVVKQ